MLGHILLMGVGGGASPVAATICMMLLNTSRPLATAHAFMLGHGAVLAAVGAAALAGFGGGSWFGDFSPAVRHALDAAIGVLLLAFALKQWRDRPARNAPPPRWMTTIDSITPGKAYLFGSLKMATDVGALALFVSGLKEIIAADVGAAASAATFAVFVMLIEMASLVPIAVYTVSPARGGAMLGSARRWLERNTRLITVILFAVFGVLLLAKGAWGFLT